MYKNQHLRTAFVFTFNIKSFQYIAIEHQKEEQHWQLLK